MSKARLFNPLTFILTLTLLVFLSSLFMSCGKPSTKYGAEFTIQEKPIPVGELLLRSEGRVGKVVKVRGKLAAVCRQKGCFFSLINNAGSKVYVDLEAGKKFTIPIDSENKMGVVEGKFMFNMDVDKRGWQIIADAVQIYEE